MKIVLELDKEYTITSDSDDFDADELKEMFSRLLVTAGYAPSVLEMRGDDGRWEYVDSSKVIVDSYKAGGVNETTK